MERYGNATTQNHMPHAVSHRGNGRHEEARTPDLYRVNGALRVVLTTYKARSEYMTSCSQAHRSTPGVENHPRIMVTAKPTFYEQVTLDTLTTQSTHYRAASVHSGAVGLNRAFPNQRSRLCHSFTACSCSQLRWLFRVSLRQIGYTLATLFAAFYCNQLTPRVSSVMCSDA
jgi:hypothetical protein